MQVGDTRQDRNTSLKLKKLFVQKLATVVDTIVNVSLVAKYYFHLPVFVYG